MPTHGRARQLTINALESRTPFSRPGYSMRGVEGAVSNTGRMPKEAAEDYKAYAAAENILYTVTSYSTPIAWVTQNEKVIIPEVKYSQTTTQQQSLCRVYL